MPEGHTTKPGSTKFDYCKALYGDVSQASLSHVQLVQNAAARLLRGTCKRENITLMFASLQWIPIHFRIKIKSVLFAFTALKVFAPLIF